MRCGIERPIHCVTLSWAESTCCFLAQLCHDIDVLIGQSYKVSQQGIRSHNALFVGFQHVGFDHHACGMK